MKKVHLTLEFVVGETTYWMTSATDEFRTDSVKEQVVFFTKIPKVDLPNFNLNADKIWIRNDSKPGSSIDIDDDGIWFYEEKEFSQAIKINLDYKKYSQYPWAELIKIFKKESVENLIYLCHNQLFKKSKSSVLEIPDVGYKVSAFLPPEIFAMRGEDWSIEKPNWFTFNCENEEEFLKQFDNFDLYGYRFGGKEYYLA